MMERYMTFGCKGRINYIYKYLSIGEDSNRILGRDYTIIPTANLQATHADLC